MKTSMIKNLLLLFVLLACLTACAAPDVAASYPAVTDTPSAAPSAAPAEEPSATPSHQLVSQRPEPPYLLTELYVRGQYVTGYIPLTQQEVMDAMLSSELVDTMMTVALSTRENPEESYGPLPRPLADIAAQTAGFTCQSPADVGNIVSATMDTTLFGVTRSQTVTDPAALDRLETILKGASLMTFRSGCPWTGVLTLTMDDGRTMVIQKATDSCEAMLFGTSYCYKISKEDNQWLWELFHEAAPDHFAGA